MGPRQACEEQGRSFADKIEACDWVIWRETRVVNGRSVRSDMGKNPPKWPPSVPTKATQNHRPMTATAAMVRLAQAHQTRFPVTGEM
jgi:hypothetical protein